MMKFLWSEVGSPLRNDVFTANVMLIEKVAVLKQKSYFYLGVVADLPVFWCFYCACHLGFLSSTVCPSLLTPEKFLTVGSDELMDLVVVSFLLFISRWLFS
ncbi:MAG: hypothetical protein ACOVO4_01305 [Limnohabitans sp.]